MKVKTIALALVTGLFLECAGGEQVEGGRWKVEQWNGHLLNSETQKLRNLETLEPLNSETTACEQALDRVASGLAPFDGVALVKRPYAAFAARRSADGKTAFVAVDDGQWPVDPEYRLQVDGRPRRVEGLLPDGRWKEVGFDYYDEKKVVLFRHPAPTAVACARLSLHMPAERPAFTGEDSPAIERMIARAIQDGSRRVTLAKKADGTPWYLTRAILLPDDFTLEIDDCTVQLAPFVKDNLIRNAGAQEGHATPNRNITIRGKGNAVLCGGLENHYAPRRSGDTNGWRALGVVLHDVDGFVLDGVTLRETQSWGVSIENGSCHGRVSNIRLEDTNLLFNQDGIDVRAGCHDIVIENISGTCGDDAVALTGVGPRGVPLSAKDSGGKITTLPLALGNPRLDHKVCEKDDIYNVTISNVHARSAGGHSVVRLLCQDGVKLHHVTVRDVVDTTEDGQLEAQATIRIGDFNYWTDRPAQMGDMHHVTIENVKARGKFGISFKGPLSDSVIRNVSVRPKTPAYDVRAAFRNVLFDSSDLPSAAKAGEFDGYRKVVMDEAKELDAFDNPAFEDMSKYGKVSENAEIGRFGFNGNGGLRLRPYDKKLAYGFPLKARLENGRRYVFSADVRTHGDTSAQIACDVWWKATGKVAEGHGAWGPATTDLGDGWRHMELEFLAKGEPDELRYKLMAYCIVTKNGDAASPDNWVEVDNLAIRVDAPKWYFCNTWPTHNRIHREEGRVRCHSAFFGRCLEKDADPAYAAKLLKPDGTVLAERTRTPDEKGNMTFDFGALDYEGPVTLAATLYDRRNRLELGTRTRKLRVERRPDPAKGLFCREDGVMLKDGKPFMPLGFYTGLADPRKYAEAEVEQHLKAMHDAGFNVMMDYQTYMLPLGGKRMDWYYGLCEKYGICVVNDDFKVCTGLEKVPEMLPALRKRAEVVSKYPAVVGFYILDEGGEGMVPWLAMVREMLNEVAPAKMVNICNIMRPAPYLPIADVQGGDSYPVSNNPQACLATTHRRISAMRDCAPAAIWFAPQCYNWASMVRGAMKDAELFRKSGREPTEHEMLSVALCNVADGVTGFLFFSHDDLFACPVKEWIPRRWEAVCNVGKCLRELEPFIMSGQKIVDVPHEDKADATRMAALTDGKGAWRVIVCGLGKNHETTFKLPAAYGQLKSRCGKTTFADGAYTFVGKDFTCDILE